MIRTKRIYDPPADDGYRILIIGSAARRFKENAHIDRKEIARQRN